MIKPGRKYYTPDQLLKRISTNPAVCSGKPCIKGHRIRVHQILGLLSTGVFPEEITQHYFPSITLEDVYACIAYANQPAQEEQNRLFKQLMQGR